VRKASQPPFLHAAKASLIHPSECVEGLFSELHLQHPAYPRPYGAENARWRRPVAERRCPHVVVPHKDALACVGKDRRRGSERTALGTDRVTTLTDSGSPAVRRDRSAALGLVVRGVCAPV
jgi:hypothetical protein